MCWLATPPALATCANNILPASALDPSLPPPPRSVDVIAAASGLILSLLRTRQARLMSARSCAKAKRSGLAQMSPAATHRRSSWRCATPF